MIRTFPMCMVRTRGKRLVFPGFFLLVMVTVTACSKTEEPMKQKPSVPVTVAAAVEKSVPLQIRAIGNVEAYNSVAVKSQVSGVVAKVHFREGQDVKRGDLLFTIDPRPFEAALKQAEALLARDTAQARHNHEQVRRYGALLKDGIVTQEQYDQYRTAADSAEASIAADRAAVDNAKIQLGYCYIRSPIEGRTGNLAVNVGNMVKANDLPVLVTINQISPIYVTFSVPEHDMVRIRAFQGKGVLVEATVAGDDGKGEKGTISFLDNAVDTATGTIKLKGTFANSGRKLWPGQFANLVLTLSTIDRAITVPTRAIQTGQQGQYVFVVKTDQTVEQRPVTVGISTGSETVIERGVGVGETVVTDGQVRLAPGARIAVIQSGAASSAPPAAPAGSTSENLQGKTR